MAYRFAATHHVVACAGVCAGHLSAGLVRLSSPVALMCVSGEQEHFPPINGGHAGAMGGTGVVFVPLCVRDTGALPVA